MATETKVVKGWLKDKNGNYFAPKTLVSQVADSDGNSLEDVINGQIDDVSAEANKYTDEQLNARVGVNNVETQIETHNSSNEAHSDIRTDITNLSNNKINASDIANNLTTSESNKVLSAAQGVVIKEDIDNLSESFDKHNHNELYFTQEEITTKIDEVKSGIPLIQFVTWGDDD